MDVKIYKPAKTTTQSGRGNLDKWFLEYEAPTARRPEPLMGWTQADDTLNQVRLRFKTLEEAVGYAEKKGWSYTVLPVHERRVQPRNYGDNFIYKAPEIADPRKDMRPEENKRPGDAR